MRRRTSSAFARFTGGVVCGATIAVQAASLFDVRIPGEFSRVVDTNIVALTTNATTSLGSGTILEGPTWVPGSPGYLLFSIFTYNNYGHAGAGIKKLVLPNTVTDFLIPAPYTVYNGSILDGQERLISCQSGTAGLRVVRITNGVVTPLVSNCAGLKFYSPNDVVVKSDGTLWFTDPGFNGITATPPQSGYQGGHYVYRFDPADGNGTCAPVITNIFRPNGLCFSPDESVLYLADYDGKAIRVYSVSSSNTLSGGSVFASITNGSPDGIRCDAEGRVYSSSGNGVYVYLPYPDGRLIGRIITPALANLCFGGADYRTLFITAQPNVYSIQIKVAGAVAIRKLNAHNEGDDLLVSWPAPSTGFKLQATDGLGPVADWTFVTNSPQTSNGLNRLVLPATNTGGFYRLRLN